MSLEIYDDYDRRKECLECDQKDEYIENVKYWLEAVIEHLYSKEQVLIEDFERCVEELAGSADMKLPKGDLQTAQIVPKINPHNRTYDINWWKMWNHEELKKLGEI